MAAPKYPVVFTVVQRLDGSPAAWMAWWHDPAGEPHCYTESLDLGASWEEVYSCQRMFAEATWVDPW